MPSMLPAPTTPLPLLAALRRVVALLLSVVLSFTLSACGGSQPSQKVLLSALALQIDLTQRSIADALQLTTAEGLPQVSRVRVESQQALPIGGSKGVDSAFDLYLQRGERGQSWRLARPSGSSDGATQDWIIDPLPIA
jgi:hypothetical protein